MTAGGSRPGWDLWLVGGLVLGAIASSPAPVQAQLTPDNTLGAEASTVDAEQLINGQPSNAIGGGAVRGINLFHSFQEFNVGVDRGVYFANPAGVTNILTRVTGTNPSNIFGTLGVLGPANLYLINPNGILFGPNASLNVQGSFLATTANGIQLGTTGLFSATDPASSTLVAVQPGALFLNALANQTITNQATLQAGQNLSLISNTVTNSGALQAGQNLTLQGNTVSSSGTLLAPTGSVTVSATAGDATVQALNAQTAALSASNTLNLSGSQVTTTGDLTLTAQNTVQIADTDINPANLTAGGNLTIQGDQGIVIDSLRNPGSLIQTLGELSITSSNGPIVADGLLTSDGNATLSAGTTLTSTGGQITSTGGNLALLAGSNLSLTNNQLSAAGTLSIAGQGVLQIQDTPTSPLIVNAGSNLLLQGNQGITISTINPSSQLQSGGSVGLISNNSPISSTIPITSLGGLTIQGASDVTFGNFTGSSFSLTTSGTIAVGSIDTSSATGDGGAVSLSAGGNLSATGINTASTAPLGNGGSVQLTATGGAVNIANGIDSSAANGSGGAIAVLAGSTANLGPVNTFSLALGNGGAVNIAANQAITTQGIDTSSVNGNAGSITLTSLLGSVDTSLGSLNAFADEVGGNGGTITLNARNNITTGTIQAYGGSAGGGGAIRLTGGGAVLVNSNTVLDSSTFGPGAAGAIAIVGQSFTLGADVLVYANSLGSGNSGNIDIQAPTGSITIGTGSQVQTAVEVSGTGSAGSINLTAGSIALQPNSGLFSSVDGGDGAGGNVNLTALNGAIAGTSSVIATTTSGAGVSGNVNLTADGIVLVDSTIDAAAFATGSNGNILVRATNNGTVYLSGGIFYADTFPTNTGTNGGDITIQGGNITLNNFQLEAPSRGAVNGRNITIDATQQVSLENNSLLRTSVEDTGTGRGGTIAIRSSSIFLTGNSAIDATTASLSSTGIGGDVSLTATNLLSLQQGSQITTTVQPNGVAAGGSITLSSKTINLDGARVDANTFGTGTGGSIQLSGPTVSLTNQSEVNAKTSSAGQGGNVTVNAGNGSLLLSNASKLNTAAEGAAGNGGEITVNVGRLNLLSGGQLVSSSSGTGAAGNITVNATQEMTVSGSSEGSSSGLFAQSTGSGPAGDLTLSTPNLLVQDGAEISVATQGSGMGGRLAIKTQQLQVLSNAEISASTSGQGRGGILTVNADDSVLLDSGGRLAARSSGNGSAGSLAIVTDKLQVQNGAQATVSSSGSGNAGNLDIAARSVTLDRGGRLAADTVDGNGGNIQLTVREDLTLRNGAEISTASTGSGNAGRIGIQANSLFLKDGGRIVSRSTAQGNAGSITVNLRDRLRMSAGEISASSEQGGGGRIDIAARDILLTNSSLISSSVSDGSGGGGNISIRASQIFLAFADSDVLANAQFGDGGSIAIAAPVFIADLFATIGRNPGRDFSRFRGNGRVDISASSVFGVGGTVQIPDISFIQYSLNALPEDFVNSDQIVAGSCLTRRNAQRGSFVVTGTGGLARTPYSQMAGRYDVAPVKPISTPSPSRLSPSSPPPPSLAWKPGDPIQEAQGFITTPDGRVVLGTTPQLTAVMHAEDLVCDFDPPTSR